MPRTRSGRMPPKATPDQIRLERRLAELDAARVLTPDAALYNGGTATQPLPAAVEAEEALLGGLMDRPDLLPELATWLDPSMFWDDRNAILYRTMMDLYGQANPQPPDQPNLLGTLTRTGRLEAIGGPERLVQLRREVGSNPHFVNYYGKRIWRASFMRDIITAGGDIAAIGYSADLIDADDGLDRILEQAQAILQRASSGVNQSNSGLRSIKDVLKEQYERLSDAASGKAHVLPTFSQLLNKVLVGGLHPEDVYVVAALTGVGKTWFVLTLLHDLAQKGKHVGLYSLEMSAEQVLQRLIAMQSGIPHTQLLTGNDGQGLTDAEWSKWMDAVAALSEMPISLDDGAGQSVYTAMLRARKRHAEQPLDLIIIDYLQLMSGDTDGSRYEEVDKMMNAIKQMARDLHVPVIVISQLSKEADKAAEQTKGIYVPTQSTLRESGGIQHTASAVIFLGRNTIDPDLREITRVAIPKNRHHDPHNGWMAFDRELQRYRDAQQGEILMWRELLAERTKKEKG